MYDVLIGLTLASAVVVLVRSLASVMREQGRRRCLICGEPVRIGGIFGWLEPPVHNPDTHPDCRRITIHD